VNKRCWLIADHHGPTPTLAAQFARLRNIEVLGPAAEKAPQVARPESAVLIATSFAMLDRMTVRDRESLRTSVNAGATLYVRGEVENGSRYQLAPLIDASFTLASVADVAAYRFTAHELIPAVLRREKTPHRAALNCASDLSGPAEPILFACQVDGGEAPVVFAYRAGKGVIICDVQLDDESADVPIIWRLCDPHRRCANIGALIAVDRAVNRDMAVLAPFNLTIDDMPLGYDYLNEAILENFLEHLGRRCPGFHLDCAWIPSSQWISKRYIEILKQHDTGFVWHGLHRHINHQQIGAPLTELEAGKRSMAAIVRRYRVRVQPLMIFPFERAHRSSEELLLKEGFLAAAEQPRNNEYVSGADAAYLRYASPLCVHESGLRFLHRYESAFLSRDRMTAIAALGMPILGFGHPKDVRLRRLSRFVDRGGTFEHFDEVLDFAAAKGLAGRSLEEIAQQLFNGALSAVPQL
jgi:hypothetical protein